jgi:hypothetical protein
MAQGFPAGNALIGRLSELPLFPPSNYPAGTWFISTSPPAFFVSDGNQWVGETGLAGPQTFYLDSAAGNDANNGMTKSTAWKTLLPGFSLLNGLTQIGVSLTFEDIAIAGGGPGGSGLYSWPQVSANPNGPQLVNVPAPMSPNAIGFQFQGQIVDAGVYSGVGAFGFRTIGLVATVVVAGQNVTQITDATLVPAPPAADTLIGGRIRVVTGLAAGTCMSIDNNHVPPVTQLVSQIVGLAPGDMYVYERPGTIIENDLVNATEYGFDGAGVGTGLFYGVKFVSAQAGNLIFQRGNWGFAACEGAQSITNKSAFQIIDSECSCGWRGFLFGTNTNPSDDDFSAFDGLFLHDGLPGDFAIVSSLFVGTVVMQNITLSQGGGTVLASPMVLHEPSAIAGIAGFQVAPIPETTALFGGVAWAYPFTTAPVLQTRAGARCQLSGFQVVDARYGTAQTGIQLDQAPACQIANFTAGAGAIAGVALDARHGTTCRVPDASVTTTAAGGGGDVLVGGNAVTTWALIAAGTTAIVTDVGAAKSQLCAVTT